MSMIIELYISTLVSLVCDMNVQKELS